MLEHEIFETQDGSHSIVSKTFGVSYHSKYGAIQETRHVFIEAGLLYKTDDQHSIAILDVGFGTGLNAYLTFLEAQSRQIAIRYQAVEKYPLAQSHVDQLNYETILSGTKGDFDVFRKMHTAQWNDWIDIAPEFSFRKLEMDIQSVDYNNIFDIVYFDAFAPSSQPELWEAPVLEKMRAALKPEGCLVTYCAKGSFKRTLKQLGFEVETLQGPPGKREMTRAIRK